VAPYTPTLDISQKKGIPQCSKEIEGQTVDFAEDRKYRNYTLKCSKDENQDYTWKPAGATPVFFRTTLPKCDEKTHGMDAVLDEGLNSSPLKCVRYQGEMKWVMTGKREPMRFYDQDPPLSRQQFLDSKKIMPKLQDPTSSFSNLVGSVSPQILRAVAAGVPAFSSTSPLGAALIAANAISGTFNGSELLSNIASTVINGIDDGEFSVDSLISLASSSLTELGITDQRTANILGSLGNAGANLVKGLQDGSLNTENLLQDLGQDALRETFRAISPELGSVYYGYMTGGLAGAIDSAAMVGIPQLPQEINDVIKPLLSIGAGVLESQSQGINSVLNSAVGLNTSTPIDSAISSVVNIAKGGPTGALSSAAVAGATAALNAGGLGQVAQTIGPFASLTSVPKLDATDLPGLASTALEIAGMGQQFSSLLGGGIGLQGASNLLGGGANPVAGLLGGVIGGLGGAGAGCPCSPSCRKVKHSEDSDGNTLLEPCGNVVANSHSSYAPENDPTKNNENIVAESLGRIPTLIGKELCVPNLFDLTEMIQEVDRLKNMADRFESSKDADWPEMWSELNYTFETIEKAFKQTDRNITKLEGTVRGLLDSQARMANRMLALDGSFLPTMLLSMVDSYKAIQDIYEYVRRLDSVKDGGGAGVAVTGNLSTTFRNIVRIAKQITAAKKEADFQFGNYLNPVDKEWRDMNPAKGIQSLKDIILAKVPTFPDVNSLFGKCSTVRDKSRVLKDSLEAKLNSPVPGGDSDSGSSLSSKISPKNKNKAKSLSIDPTDPTPPPLSTLLDQIQYEQGRAQEGKADC
jgi:hypothetical protein